MEFNSGFKGLTLNHDARNHELKKKFSYYSAAEPSKDCDNCLTVWTYRTMNKKCHLKMGNCSRTWKVSAEPPAVRKHFCPSTLSLSPVSL